MPPLSLTCLTASSTPCRVGRPADAAAPDSGRSTPILNVPLFPPDEPVEGEPPHANTANAAPAAMARNLALLIRIIQVLPLARHSTGTTGPSPVLFPPLLTRG